MELISTESGRVASLFPAEETRSLSGGHAPSAIHMVQERYSFGYAPDLRRAWEDIQKDGLRFQLGKFMHGNKAINIKEFTVYNDGLVVTAFNTDDAEIFLKDILAWSKEVFGMRDPKTTVRTLYVSQLLVEFRSSLNPILDGFEVITGQLNKYLKASYGIEEPVQFSGLGLNYDRSEVPAWQNVAQFLLERRIGYPYSKNRYFTEAPLRTQEHLNLLQVIESVVEDSQPSTKKK